MTSAASRRRFSRVLAVVSVLVLLTAGCGDDDGGDDAGGEAGATTVASTAPAGTGAGTSAAPGAETTAAPGGGVGSAFAITRVELGADGFAEVTNVSDGPADPDGWFVCQFPNYIPLGPGELAPGESVTVTASALGDLDPISGEVGLYSAGGNFGDSSLIVDYVEWGEPGHQRAPVAEAAGIWSPLDAVVLGGSTAIVATADGFAAE